jgi:hypothetical protein
MLKKRMGGGVRRVKHSNMCQLQKGWGLGCALTFASEAKIEIEAKISFRLEAKKSLISHDSL